MTKDTLIKRKYYLGLGIVSEVWLSSWWEYDNILAGTGENCIMILRKKERAGRGESRRRSRRVVLPEQHLGP